MILVHAIVAVIHAILLSAVEALIAGFSLLLMLLVILVVLGALIVTLTGCLGIGGGIRWFRRRRNGKDGCD